MPLWLVAGLWGLIAGSALLIGALVGYFARVSQRLVAAIMAFGSGVLVSALSFDLMDEAFKRDGLVSTSIGFLTGAAIYTVANVVINRWGTKHRKHSCEKHPSEEEVSGSGTAIAVGAMIDGIPESIVIGVSLIPGGAVGWVAVLAIFLSNIPEGLSSSAGMKRAGRSRRYVFGLWCGVVLLSGLAALLGFVMFRHYPPSVVAATTAVAAGGILAMLVDTMIPEAFEETHEFAGLITVVGFLLAFCATKMK